VRCVKLRHVAISVVRATIRMLLELARPQDANGCVFSRTNKHVIDIPKDYRVHPAQTETSMVFLGKVEERILRPAPAAGKSLRLRRLTLLSHPSADSLHRPVPSQMGPGNMRSEFEKESPSRTATRSTSTDAANRVTERRPGVDELSTSQERDCASSVSLRKYRGARDPASSRHS